MKNILICESGEEEKKKKKKRRRIEEEQQQTSVTVYSPQFPPSCLQSIQFTVMPFDINGKNLPIAAQSHSFQLYVVLRHVL